LDFADPCAECRLLSHPRFRCDPCRSINLALPFEEPDDIDEAALAAVLRVVPLGTAVLAGSAVALMVLGYLAIYLLIFLPRGAVG
jgi:hypothetical protein